MALILIYRLLRRFTDSSTQRVSIPPVGCCPAVSLLLTEPPNLRGWGCPSVHTECRNNSRCPWSNSQWQFGHNAIRLSNEFTSVTSVCPSKSLTSLTWHTSKCFAYPQLWHSFGLSDFKYAFLESPRSFPWNFRSVYLSRNSNMVRVFQEPERKHSRPQ